MAGILIDWSLAAKVGSALVHAEEMLGNSGHAFDKAALQQMLADTEVQFFLEQLRKDALLPVKRG